MHLLRPTCAAPSGGLYAPRHGPMIGGLVSHPSRPFASCNLHERGLVLRAPLLIKLASTKLVQPTDLHTHAQSETDAPDRLRGRIIAVRTLPLLLVLQWVLDCVVRCDFLCVRGDILLVPAEIHC